MSNVLPEQTMVSVLDIIVEYEKMELESVVRTRKERLPGKRTDFKGKHLVMVAEKVTAEAWETVRVARKWYFSNVGSVYG
jgi:hypothetical protein